MGNGQIEPSQLGHKKRSSRPGCCGKMRERRVMVGILLAKDINGPCTAGNIQPLADRIVEQVVGIADNSKVCDHFTCTGIVNQHLRRVATAYEETMVRL